jgi:integrase
MEIAAPLSRQLRQQRLRGGGRALFRAADEIHTAAIAVHKLSGNIIGLVFRPFWPHTCCLIRSRMVTGKHREAASCFPSCFPKRGTSGVKLTQKTIADLPLPRDRGKADVLYFDDQLAGFALRVREGRRTWVAQFRIGRRQRRMTLGPVEKVPLEMARAKAKTLLAQAALGDDPQAEKIAQRAKADIRLGAIIDAYLEAMAPGLRPNTIRGNEYYLRRLWAPLHKLSAGEIERADIAARIRKLTVDHGATTATRARAALSGVFAWAMKEGLPIEQNPVIHTNTPPQPDARDRVLNHGELAEIWGACADDYGRIIKLLICTGCRRQEIGSMRWSELRDGMLHLPPARTKNGEPHSIPIIGLAAEIIAGVPNVAGCDLLFGTGVNGFSGWSTGWTALTDRIDEVRKARGGEPMPHWTAHDLRRTVATRMADIGVEPWIIEACLNHRSGHRGGIAGVYNKSRYEAGIRAAFARWDDELRSILGGERRIVPLPTAS